MVKIILFIYNVIIILIKQLVLTQSTINKYLKEIKESKNKEDIINKVKKM